MAEAVMLICDVCGKPATSQATIRMNGRNFVKDFCDGDAAALVRNARAPKRGRRPKSVETVSKSAARKTAGTRSPRKIGQRRPRKAVAKRNPRKSRKTVS